MKQKQNIRELEKKMEILTRELDVFQNELMVIVQIHLYYTLLIYPTNTHSIK